MHRLQQLLVTEGGEQHFKNLLCPHDHQVCFWADRFKLSHDELRCFVHARLWQPEENFRRIGQWNHDGSGNFSTWYSRVVKNCAIKLSEQYTRHDKRTTPLPEGDHPSLTRAPFNTETIGFLDLVFSYLADEEGDLIRLRYLEGLTAKEIAELTGASHDAVRQRLSRTMRKLRKWLEE